MNNKISTNYLPGQDEAVSRRQLLKVALASPFAAVATGCWERPPDSERGSPVGPYSLPHRGGNMRVGVIEVSQTGNLDAHAPVGGGPMRGWALYAKLWEWTKDGSPTLALAEEAEIAGDGLSWTIRLKPGLEFHHGKTISADDVIFSIRRLTDPQLASPYAMVQSMVDRDTLEKLDKRTVRLHAKNGQGLVPLAEAWTSFGGIVPTDYHPVTNPVGAGPFRLKRFIPGRRSRFERFENYFKPGQPYAETLEIIEFPDHIARLSALVTGQIDVAPVVPAEYSRLLGRDGRSRVITSPSNGWLAFNMNLLRPPFSDVRVRQAFRLLIDRADLVRRVLRGEGRVANDLYAPQDPLYDGTIRQRQHDPRAARALLDAAGHGRLSVELVTDADGEAASLVFAEQAKKANVEIIVRKVDNATYNGPQRNDWALSTSTMPARDYLASVMFVDGPGSPANRSNFRDERFSALLADALAEPDLERRKALAKEMQRIQHDRGGLIVWGFVNVLNACSPHVGGIGEERTMFAAWRFENLWKQR